MDMPDTYMSVLKSNTVQDHEFNKVELSDNNIRSKNKQFIGWVYCAYRFIS